MIILVLLLFFDYFFLLLPRYHWICMGPIEIQELLLFVLIPRRDIVHFVIGCSFVLHHNWLLIFLLNCMKNQSNKCDQVSSVSWHMDEINCIFMFLFDNNWKKWRKQSMVSFYYSGIGKLHWFACNLLDSNLSLYKGFIAIYFEIFDW